MGLFSKKKPTASAGSKASNTGGKTNSTKTTTTATRRTDLGGGTLSDHPKNDRMPYEGWAEQEEAKQRQFYFIAMDVKMALGDDCGNVAVQDMYDEVIKQNIPRSKWRSHLELKLAGGKLKRQTIHAAERQENLAKENRDKCLRRLVALWENQALTTLFIIWRRWLDTERKKEAHLAQVKERFKRTMTRLMAFWKAKAETSAFYKWKDVVDQQKRQSQLILDNANFVRKTLIRLISHWQNQALAKAYHRWKTTSTLGPATDLAGRYIANVRIRALEAFFNSTSELDGFTHPVCLISHMGQKFVLETSDTVKVSTITSDFKYRYQLKWSQKECAVKLVERDEDEPDWRIKIRLYRTKNQLDIIATGDIDSSLFAHDDNADVWIPMDQPLPVLHGIKAVGDDDDSHDLQPEIRIQASYEDLLVVDHSKPEAPKPKRVDRLSKLELLAQKIEPSPEVAMRMFKSSGGKSIGMEVPTHGRKNVSREERGAGDYTGLPMVKRDLSRYLDADILRHAHQDCYTGIDMGQCSDSSFGIKANARFLLLPWGGSTEGGIAVLRRSQVGPQPVDTPFMRAHKRSVCDLDLHPQEETLFASSSLDQTVKLWTIEEADVKSGEAERAAVSDRHLKSINVKPAATLEGHGRKINILAFDKMFGNLLASTGGNVVKLWDVSNGSEALTLAPLAKTSSIESLSWKTDGSGMATTDSTGAISIWDLRAGDVSSTTPWLSPNQFSSVLWLNSRVTLFSIGATEQRTRNFAIWDARNMSAPLLEEELDGGVGPCMAIQPKDHSLLVVGGKNDNILRLYELLDREPYLQFLKSYESNLKQQGLAISTEALDDDEILRIFKLTSRSINPLSVG